MSSVPPEQPSEPTPPPSSQQAPVHEYRGLGQAPGAILPIPGNAELAVFLLIELLFAIVWAASDQVGAAAFVTATAVITFGYLVSRGIAKASRVLEQ